VIRDADNRFYAVDTLLPHCDRASAYRPPAQILRSGDQSRRSGA